MRAKERTHLVTALCSEGSMFRRFYIQKIFVQKVLCSENPIFRRSYVQKVLCSEGPMFRKYLFKRSYIQKVLCSEGPIFRYIQKVLYSENSLFYVEKNLHLSVSGKLQCKITNHSVSFALIRSDELFFIGPLSVVCTSIICRNRYWDFNQHYLVNSHKTRSDHRRIVSAIQEYDIISEFKST